MTPQECCEKCRNLIFKNGTIDCCPCHSKNSESKECEICHKGKIPTRKTVWEYDCSCHQKEPKKETYTKSAKDCGCYYEESKTGIDQLTCAKHSQETWNKLSEPYSKQQIEEELDIKFYERLPKKGGAKGTPLSRRWEKIKKVFFSTLDRVVREAYEKGQKEAWKNIEVNDPLYRKLKEVFIDTAIRCANECTTWNELKEKLTQLKK